MLRAVAVLVLMGALVASGCGSDEGSGSAPAPPEPVAVAPAGFPSGKGKTLDELTRDRPEGPILAPAVSQLKVGTNRLAFALFDRARKQMDVSAVAVYTARTDGSQVRGPFVARKESLNVAARFRSAGTKADLAKGDAFYVARIPFRSRGERLVVGLARLDGRLVVASPLKPVAVGARGGPPDVGDRAIPIHTLTADDVGDLRKLSTRVPPPREMLTTDFADVLGKRPIVLVFATPALCESRTCGPVVDIAEEVRFTSGKGVTFIQQEIYKDNMVSKGFRPQVGAWRLPTEPWAFVIDRSGRIAARFEGVFSVGELARAVEKVR